MSKKSCSSDNTGYEGVFGRTKNKIFCDKDCRGVDILDFKNDSFIWYNELRDLRALCSTDQA